MIKKIKQLAVDAKLGHHGEVLLSKDIIELDDSILQNISGSSGNLDCTNKNDCTHATNYGTCTNSGTCFTQPTPTGPTGT